MTTCLKRTKSWDTVSHWEYTPNAFVFYAIEGI